jgi:acyl dehydratase
VHAHGTRPAGRHAAVTLRYATEGAGGERVAEQWWTTVYLGTRCAETGAAAPRHAFPEEARARPLGAHAVEVDGGMARRYAEVSGDWSPHHFDPEAARRSGADRPFLHGLCTMALCAQAVTHLAGGDDPDRIGRIAVRFAAPVPLGTSLVVAVFDAGPGAVAFEAAVGGTPVVTNGWVELR